MAGLSERPWAVPVRVTTATVVIVHATSPEKARQTAQDGRWAEIVPGGQVEHWEVVGSPERQA